ncbi:hypothetical protein G7Z17_g3695 [Cylindrodendrum hubeiense]|uniref:Zn(2)-C6 fungal-type domain-containing protein n=1 Tax=Cylindrodendrum hubeiense TaxID=595255 RepID=A0A9P5HFA1_9HYPO|nr:hypothetical protein G7Z17_g3695 [Cylindrodendrum hubeiense]
MPELIGNWLHFSAREPKRKRAELVCVFCHSKKIKCDLQVRTPSLPLSRGFDKCSNCDCPDRDCHLRPSKRGKHRPVAATPHTRRDSTNIDSPPGQDGNLAEELPDDPIPVDIDGPQNQLQSPSSLHDDRIPTTAHSNSAQALPATFNPQPPQASISPTEDTCHSHAGDVDTGFLQVYGPENQLDAEQQELEAIIEIRHHVSDTPQRGLQQSFAETYWEYCYPWCPVLDRATIMGDIARSPMLENALALAASHIQPPLVPHDGPANVDFVLLVGSSSTFDGPQAFVLVVDFSHHQTRSADEPSPRTVGKSSSQRQDGLELTTTNLVDSICPRTSDSVMSE